MRSELQGRAVGAFDRLRRGVDGGRGGLLAVVAIGWLLTLGGRFLVPALLPQVRETFAISNTTAGLAVTLIWGSYALMQFPAGVLVDRLGERTLLTVSLVAAAASLALLGVTPLFGGFVAGCVLFGLGTGLYGPARGTVISNAFSTNAGVAFGVVLAAGSVGSAVLPLVAGRLVGAAGWQTLLGATAVPFLLAGAFVYRVVPASADGAGTARTTPLGATVGRNLRRREVAAPVVAVALMLFVFQGLTAFLPVYLIEAKGLSQATAAALFAALFASAAVCQLLAGRAADRFGARPVLIAVAGLSVLTVGALPFVAGLLPLAALMAALGARMAVAPVTNSYVIDALPAAVQGTVWGLLRTLLFLFAAAGSTVVGRFADLGLFDVAWVALAGVTVVAVGAYAAMPGAGASR